MTIDELRLYNRSYYQSHKAELNKKSTLIKRKQVLTGAINYLIPEKFLFDAF
jgi:hypothetical protein